MNDLITAARRKMEAGLSFGGNPNSRYRTVEIRTFCVLLLAWLAVVVTVAFHHEFWRDEVRALSLATGAQTPFEIIKALQDEGHPGLWYLILHIGYSLTHSQVVLPIASIAIAFSFVALFLFRAPFPIWFKLMFVFGILPLYEYSVMARNYGISVLLFFIFARSYDRRQNNSILIGTLLALLANTNVHSMILSGLLGAVWLSDEFFISHGKSMKKTMANCWPGILVAGLGVILALVTIWPRHSIVRPPVERSLSEVASAIFLNIILPGRNFLRIFPMKDSTIFASLMAWILVLGLARQPRRAIALLAGFSLIGMLANLVYAVELRHQGIVFAFAICLYWISQREIQNSRTLENSQSPLRSPAYLTAIFLIFPIIFGNHLYKGIKNVVIDLNQQRSSNAAFGLFLSEHPEFHDAIIMAEPDYFIEALPYYVENPIYLPRESRFGKIFRLTTESRAKLSLKEVLETAQWLSQSEGKPVLIVLGTILIDIDGSPAKEVSYGPRSFSWTAGEVADFHAATHKVAQFTAATTDENYFVYQVN